MKKLSELFIDPDENFLRDMFGLDVKQSMLITQQINNSIKAFKVRWANRALEQKDQQELARILSHRTRFIYSVFGHIEYGTQKELAYIIFTCNEKYVAIVKELETTNPALMMHLSVIRKLATNPSSLLLSGETTKTKQ